MRYGVRQDQEDNTLSVFPPKPGWMNLLAEEHNNEDA